MITKEKAKELIDKAYNSLKEEEEPKRIIIAESESHYIINLVTKNKLLKQSTPK